MDDARVSLVDTRDVATVIAAVLLHGGPANTELVVTGGEALTYGEAVEQIGAAIGRALRCVPLEEATERMLATGMPPVYVHDVMARYRVFRNGYCAAVTLVVQQITGRPSISVDRFARDYNAALIGGA